MPQHHRNRRDFLTVLAAASVGGFLSGCAPTPHSVPKSYPRFYSRKPWAVPRVSMDDIIRVVVGHRPYRPEGFRVEAEPFDDKVVVHNYGHGGAGLSLAWGSSALAVRQLAGRQPGSVAVVGSGIMGLTTARLLQDAGWQVTIYSRDPARHTTSNVAAGEWGPFSAHNPYRSSDAFKAQLEWAARISHHAYTNLTGPDYGIRWLEAYTLSDSRPMENPEGDLSDLYAYTGILGPGEHPFPSQYVQHLVTMQIDPGVLLRRLVQDVQGAGGRFVVRDFKDLPDLLSLEETVIFNCTGLGARYLFDDQGLTAAKGQLVFFPPDPAVDYMTFGGGQGMLHMFPRSDVLLLGGIFKRDDFSTHPEPDETERIVTAHQRIFQGFG